MKIETFALCLGLSVVGTVPAMPQETGFDPQGPCAQVIRDYGPPAAVWASGYLSALEGNMRGLDRGTLGNLGLELTNACKTAPRTGFATIVAQLASDQLASDQLASDTPTSEPALAQPVSGGVMPPNVPEIARPLVEKFLAPDADLAEILGSVQPTRADIATLYPASMLDQLDELYQDMFGAMLAREIFPRGPVELTLGFTSTFELGQAPFLGELPGGFKQVLDLFQVDVPFGYIEVVFTEGQEDIRLSGFVYLNGRWVLMPRPWRAID